MPGTAAPPAQSAAREQAAAGKTAAIQTGAGKGVSPLSIPEASGQLIKRFIDAAKESVIRPALPSTEGTYETTLQSGLDVLAALTDGKVVFEIRLPKGTQLSGLRLKHDTTARFTLVVEKGEPKALDSRVQLNPPPSVYGFAVRGFYKHNNGGVYVDIKHFFDLDMTRRFDLDVSSAKSFAQSLRRLAPQPAAAPDLPLASLTFQIQDATLQGPVRFGTGGVVHLAPGTRVTGSGSVSAFKVDIDARIKAATFAKDGAHVKLGETEVPIRATFTSREGEQYTHVVLLKPVRMNSVEVAVPAEVEPASRAKDGGPRLKASATHRHVLRFDEITLSASAPQAGDEACIEYTSHGHDSELRVRLPGIVAKGVRGQVRGTSRGQPVSLTLGPAPGATVASVAGAVDIDSKSGVYQATAEAQNLKADLTRLWLIDAKGFDLQADSTSATFSGTVAIDGSRSHIAAKDERSWKVQVISSAGHIDHDGLGVPVVVAAKAVKGFVYVRSLTFDGTQPTGFDIESGELDLTANGASVGSAGGPRVDLDPDSKITLNLSRSHWRQGDPSPTINAGLDMNLLGKAAFAADFIPGLSHADLSLQTMSAGGDTGAKAHFDIALDREGAFRSNVKVTFNDADFVVSPSAPAPPDRIASDPAVAGGKPIIRGTAVLVSQVVTAVAQGMSIAEASKALAITVDDVHAALQVAAQIPSTRLPARPVEQKVRTVRPLVPSTTTVIVPANAASTPARPELRVADLISVIDDASLLVVAETVDRQPLTLDVGGKQVTVRQASLRLGIKGGAMQDGAALGFTSTPLEYDGDTELMRLRLVSTTTDSGEKRLAFDPLFDKAWVPSFIEGHPWVRRAVGRQLARELTGADTLPTDATALAQALFGDATVPRRGGANASKIRIERASGHFTAKADKRLSLGGDEFIAFAERAKFTVASRDGAITLASDGPVSLRGAKITVGNTRVDLGAVTGRISITLKSPAEGAGGSPGEVESITFTDVTADVTLEGMDVASAGGKPLVMEVKRLKSPSMTWKKNRLTADIAAGSVVARNMPGTATGELRIEAAGSSLNLTDTGFTLAGKSGALPLSASATTPDGSHFTLSKGRFQKGAVTFGDQATADFEGLLGEVSGVIKLADRPGEPAQVVDIRTMQVHGRIKFDERGAHSVGEVAVKRGQASATHLEFANTSGTKVPIKHVDVDVRNARLAFSMGQASSFSIRAADPEAAAAGIFGRGLVGAAHVAIDPATTKLSFKTDSTFQLDRLVYLSLGSGGTSVEGSGLTIDGEIDRGSFWVERKAGGFTNIVELEGGRAQLTFDRFAAGRRAGHDKAFVARGTLQIDDPKLAFTAADRRPHEGVDAYSSRLAGEARAFIWFDYDNSKAQARADFRSVLRLNGTMEVQASGNVVDGVVRDLMGQRAPTADPASAPR